MCDEDNRKKHGLGGAAYAATESVGGTAREFEQGQAINQASAGSDRLHGLPTQWELQERLNKLRQEAAVVEACLANWTDEMDASLRMAHNLRVLGYRV